MRKTSLYRHFATDGSLLYVGIAKNAVCRLEGHRKASWYGDLARIEIERHKSRAHARFAEAVAIRDEAPRYNVCKPMPRDPDEYVIALSGAPTQPTVPMPFAIAYTVFPPSAAKAHYFQQHDDNPNVFGFADYGDDRSGLVRAMKYAHRPGSIIITDVPDRFEELEGEIAKRGATLLVVGEAMRFEPGDDPTPLGVAVASKQNSTHTRLYEARKPKRRKRKAKPKTETQSI